MPTVDPPPPGETGRELTGAEMALAVGAHLERMPLAQLAQPVQDLFPPRPRVGDRLLVNIGDGVLRPLLVTHVQEVLLEDSLPSLRVNGTIFCEPEDHTRPAFRGAVARSRDPQNITGRPDRFTPFGYGEYLREGYDIGQWRREP